MSENGAECLKVVGQISRWLHQLTQQRGANFGKPASHNSWFTHCNGGAHVNHTGQCPWLTGKLRCVDTRYQQTWENSTKTNVLKLLLQIFCGQIKKKELLDSTKAGHFIPQTKQVGMQWKNQILWKPKKFKVCQYIGILYLYSWMHKELATLNSRLWGTKINANDYCDTLGQLKDAIDRNRPGCLLQRVTPLHNNTITQHTSYKSPCSHFWKFLYHPPCSLALPHQSIIFNAVRFHATILLKAR